MSGKSGAAREIDGPGLVFESLTQIPAELRPHQQWVIWHWTERIGKNGTPKPTKEPVSPCTGGMAAVDNPRTWSSMSDAVAAVDRRGFDGIGFVVTREDPFCGVDLDGVIDERGQIHPEAERIVCELASYTERTPSGRGLRVWLRGKLPPSGRSTSKSPWGGKLEVYDSGRYFTVTGGHLRDTPATIESRQAEIEALHRRFWPQERLVADPTALQSVTLDDDALLSKAVAARNGAAFRALWEGDTSAHVSDHSAADQALTNYLWFWTGGDAEQVDRLFRQSGLFRPKWDERHASDGRTYGQMTIDSARRYVPDLYRGPVAQSERRDNGRAKAPGLETNRSRDDAKAVAYQLTDGGNARRLVDAHGNDLRHCPELGGWLAWDGSRWRRDRKEAERRAKQVVASMLEEAAQVEDDRRTKLAKHALKSDSAKGIADLLKMATSEPEISVNVDDFDADPWAFNVLNGTLDLRTGKPRPHRRKDLITKLAPVVFDPDAKAPTWEKHLARVLPDPAVREYVRRRCGYSLTGVVREQDLAMLYGSGANGKTTTLEAVREVWGDYAQQTPSDTLLQRRQGAIPNDVARLRGARLVLSVETDEGRRLSEVLVKQLTGGDTVTARFMRAEWFEFRPAAKIWLATNHKPVIQGTDEAIWRRIRLVQFTATIPEAERDKDMSDKLHGELPGILNWAIAACLDWQRQGLPVPEPVRDATATYRGEMDVLGAWLADRCVVRADAHATAGALYRDYGAWCADAGERPARKVDFGTRLAERGFEAGRGSGGTRIWRGVVLRVQNEPVT